ncbi:hypothetical protein EX895_003371 [Sporisorium graminicola]|uniref:Enterotoxin n=1 Tax=Sporisorium graminicola TaxID=280036 RepID=A0A4U7KTG6_9BASI|nr:hypothetical protein EX895_003371 [Sporisorium graminicola]TKY87790.1 hypothetical protein EX895_003371 [Sporisorium graminicola]
MSKAIRPHCVAAVGLLLLLVGLVSAPFSPALDNFDWPDGVEEILLSRYPIPPTHRYTEEQADGFLANAMLHYTRLAERRTRENLREENIKTRNIVSAVFLPRHRLVTDGLERKLIHRTSSPSWFSLPLLVDGTFDAGGLGYLYERLPNGGLARSLDLIRFDRFKPRRLDGFWLPTAIIRPTYGNSIERGALRFTVVHQFATSLGLYVDSHLANPDSAPIVFDQALRAKQDIWLRKVSPNDRRLITKIWHKAVDSPLVLDSPFFSREERADWTWRRLNHARASTSAHGSPGQQGSESDQHVDASTFSDDDEDAGILQGVLISGNEDPSSLYMVPGPAHEFARAAPHGAAITPNERQPLPLDATQNEAPTTLNERRLWSQHSAGYGPRINYEPSAHYEPGTRYERWRSAENVGNTALGAGVSGATRLPAEEAGLVEHDFMNQHLGFVSNVPIRPRPLYPWENRPMQSPQQPQPNQAPSYLHSLHHDSNVDLDLSLTPSHRGVQRHT